VPDLLLFFIAFNMALRSTASSSTAFAGGNITFLAEGVLNLLQVSDVDKQGLQQDVDEFFGQVRTRQAGMRRSRF